MTDLFGNNTIPETKEQQRRRRRHEERNADGSFKNNPMHKFGILEGHRCKECAYLCCNELANKYYKCKLRGCSGSPVTDHRVNWTACVKFQPK